MKLWKQGIIVLSKKRNSIKKCDYCGKSVGFPHRCSHCGEIFCVNCRLPETHKCNNFNPRTQVPLWKKINKTN